MDVWNTRIADIPEHEYSFKLLHLIRETSYTFPTSLEAASPASLGLFTARYNFRQARSNISNPASLEERLGTLVPGFPRPPRHHFLAYADTWTLVTLYKAVESTYRVYSLLLPFSILVVWYVHAFLWRVALLAIYSYAAGPPRYKKKGVARNKVHREAGKRRGFRWRALTNVGKGYWVRERVEKGKKETHETSIRLHTMQIIIIKVPPLCSVVPVRVMPLSSRHSRCFSIYICRASCAERWTRHVNSQMVMSNRSFLPFARIGVLG